MISKLFSYNIFIIVHGAHFALLLNEKIEGAASIFLKYIFKALPDFTGSP